ncbi:hypothetical protein NLG97_g6559 [Lecanicillium saksenae]|uniref:Uncharacterized protein n=1 Tax=Lecanicillium saksenae TaxID=468837 RepID=A0ACC1QQZ7_9HYPO|nr:hypothetical protein NLG97_g6559 [Lecanicillium saksenae]
MSELSRNPPRKRARGLRVRTGCSTCRARHVKCDERKPACKRCYIGGRLCVYPLASQAVANTLGRGAVDQLRETEPPDWDFMQAIRYYKSVIEPAQSSEFEPTINMDDAFRYFNEDTKFAFTCLTTANRISALGRNSGRLLGYGERQQDLSGLWASHSKYMLLLLEKMNGVMKQTLLEGPKRICRGNSTVIYCLLNLLSCDLKIKGSLWLAHLNGFLAYMTEIGGAARLLGHNRLQWEFCDLMVRIIKVNTFAPAHQLLRNEEYSELDIKVYVEASPSNDMPCPAGLLAHIMRITKIRKRVSLNPSLADALGPSIQGLFRDIEDFDVEEWVATSLLGAKEILPTLGRLFQDAVHLHALMTLPRQAVLDAHPQASSYESLCLHQRLGLMEHLRRLFPKVQYSPALLWPVVVAGVAAGAADADAAQDQTYVDSCLHAIWWQPASMGDPVYCIEKLRAFWQSGKTEWEECFYEPTPC